MVGKVVGKSKVKDVTKVLLDVDEIPKQWYNIVADLPEKLPPALNPATREPLKASDWEAIFPKGLIKQEMSTERFIKIPEGVRTTLARAGRPTPLHRAKRLEEALKTPASLFFKT